MIREEECDYCGNECLTIQIQKDDGMSKDICGECLENQ